MWFLALHSVVLASLAGVLLRLLAAHRRLVAPAAVAGVGAIAWTLLLFVVFSAESIPYGWFTVLHEGNTGRLVGALYGETLSAGPNFYAVQDLLSTPELLPARSVLHLNVWLGGLMLVFGAACAFAMIDGAFFAFLALLAFARNTLLLNIAASELPLALTGVYMFLAFPAFVLIEREVGPRWAMWLALVAIVGLGLLSAATRIETMLVWGPAGACAVQKAISRPNWDRFERAVDRAALAAWTRMRRASPWLLGALGLLAYPVALVVGQAFRRSFGVYAANAFDSVNPLGLSSLLALPGFLGHTMSLAAAVAVVIAVVTSIRRWGEYFLLPLSALALFQACWSASSESFMALFRTTPVLLPLVFLAIVQATRWLRRRAESAGLLGPAAALIALLVLAPQGAGTRELFFGPAGMAEHRDERNPGLVSMTQQNEARYLLERVGRGRGVLIVTRSVDPHDRDCPHRYLAVRPDASGPVDLGCRWSDALSRLRAEPAASLLFFRGGDCNLQPMPDRPGDYVLSDPRCDDEIAGATTVDELAFDNLQYNTMAGYLRHSSRVVLGFYDITASVRRLHTPRQL